MTLALRLVLSLRAVGTRLPIRMYLSGERHQPYEDVLREAGAALSLQWGFELYHADDLPFNRVPKTSAKAESRGFLSLRARLHMLE